MAWAAFAHGSSLVYHSLIQQTLSINYMYVRYRDVFSFLKIFQDVQGQLCRQINYELMGTYHSRDQLSELWEHLGTGLLNARRRGVSVKLHEITDSSILNKW